MNANELADKLEKCCLVSWGECNHEDYDTDIWTKMKSATMLRQQQAKLEKSQELLREYTALNMRQKTEIEALKLQLHTTLTNRDLRTYDGKAQEK
jgi:hypothetical protein